MNVIPQLFAIWRTSVLLTVGAISLGAEQLENSVKGLLVKGLKSDRTDRAPRVKVPVRAGKVETSGTARSRAVSAAKAAKAARSVTKARVTRAAAPVTAKAPAARKVRVKASAPEATVAVPVVAPVETLVPQNSAN